MFLFRESRQLYSLDKFFICLLIALKYNQPFYVEKLLPSGKKAWVLNSFLDIMYRIFHNSFPHIGDKDKVHAHLVDMMLICEEVRHSQSQPLDVSYIMWCELRFVTFTRKVPIYGPYLFSIDLEDLGEALSR